VLIANRGEIALRIVRACRELDLETVAVYSEADRDAAHTAAADRALPIGPAAAAESYLSIPAIIEAARASGADAVHPGYGFLSENAAFAAACERAGLIFIGPPAAVIAGMGSKIAARQAGAAAGIPIVPGQVPHDQSDAGLRTAIESIGYPALVKAAGGGGGKGMRVVRGAADLEAALSGARREAQAAFGDPTLYVEKRLEHPHHIEVQIVADAQGHIVHLFERECSTQRRYQKVIEESPSPNLVPALRARITAAAVRAAEAAGYRNAGTVEFLVDLTGEPHADSPFYFLEMNARLQVEHGVTELVTGVDLVRAQLLVASGEPLPWTQEQLFQRGHAIEARVYAEDPDRGFLPQAGPLLLYREPVQPGVRIDSGVREGDVVSVHYDALLAKVIALAETRQLAIARLATALRAFPVLGITTNTAFLLRILAHQRFREGRVDTTFLDSSAADLAAAHNPELESFARAALEAAPAGAGERVSRTVPDPWQQLQGWRAP
jgi:acetyl/propionyl-CoA carboxylase alpha subunit